MLHDMAKMSVTGTPGTGTITLNAAISGFQSFSASGVVDTEQVSYSIADGSNWEVGRGTYTASGTTLTRGPIYSSNSNAAISATSGAIVLIAALSQDFNTYEAGMNATSFPRIANFSWINQLSSTATNSPVGISIVPNIHSGDSMNILKQAAPGSTPFNIYARFSWVAPSINFSELGLVCVNSSNGRLVKTTLIFDGTPFQWDIQAWPGATGSIATSSSLKAMTLQNWWMQLNVTSTVMTFYASPDGFNFLQVGQQNISTYLTAAGGTLDTVGFVFQAPQDNTHSFAASINYWDTVAPV